MKVFSLYKNTGSWSIWQYIYDMFFDYTPEGITETFDYKEADVMFTLGMPDQPAVEFPDIDPVALRNPLLWNQIKGFSSVQKALRETPIIHYIDKFGVSLGDNVYRPFIRDIDIPVATAPLPPHANSYVIQCVDGRNFFKVNRLERRERSVILIQDQLLPILDVLPTLLEDGTISHLTVTKRTFEEFPQDEQDALLPAYEAGKITAGNLAHPNGVRNALNQNQFVLTTGTNQGTEYMGIEGGFCGSQPIYPDTPYYRAHFGDDMGVAYFDISSPEESLRSILTSTPNWEEHREGFIKHFAASHTMPAFWEHVRQIIEKPNNE